MRPVLPQIKVMMPISALLVITALKELVSLWTVLLEHLEMTQVCLAFKALFCVYLSHSSKVSTSNFFLAYQYIARGGKNQEKNHLQDMCVSDVQ